MEQDVTRATEEATRVRACVHCGLPVPGNGDAAAFCCTGCEIVYHALQEAGMGETYYRLRDVAPRRASKPATPYVDGLALEALDAAPFLDKHTRQVDDGTRAVDLYLDGVHCAACVWLVEQLPYAVDGVDEARLDLPRARLSLRWRPGEVQLSAVGRWLAGFGYHAHPLRQSGAAHRTEEERRLLVKVGVCWALAGNVMLIAFALYAGLDGSSDTALATAARWAMLALGVPAVLYGGSTFFKRAWSSLRLALTTRKTGALHMDTPIALGIAVGTLDSVRVAVAGDGHVWFDSITVLIAALLTARWLQLRSRRLAGDATERLLSLIPAMARRVAAGARHVNADAIEDDAIDVVPIDEIRSGDRLLVPAGDVFPADGEVVSGRSAVNNAVLTGESQPEEIVPGKRVAAAATNLSSPVVMEVTAAGAASQVGKLLAWVRAASDRPAPVVLMADRLGGYFVAAVLALALATAVLWLFLDPASAARHVVALLVITCPCALGMATPLAVAVASGKAARRGIYVKNEAATQLLTEVDTIVLDKTGTLTEGAMRVVNRAGDAAALVLATALERHSTHPLAVAITGDAKPAAMPVVSGVTVCHGKGIRGIVDGCEVIVGQPEWVQRRCVQAAPALAEALDRYAAAGHTPVAVGVDSAVTAVLAVGDTLRPDATALVARLEAEGREVHLCSGDHPAVVTRVAGVLGLAPERARGGLVPEEKQAFVERLRAGGRKVAMVGDGVNDAAALQAADVGIAVAGGSTASLVSADVFFTREGLAPLMELLEGAHSVMRVVRRNLGVSLVYNVLGAGAAVAGLVSPFVAAVAMPVSSFVVVLSSILHRSFSYDGRNASLDSDKCDSVEVLHYQDRSPDPRAAGRHGRVEGRLSMRQRGNIEAGASVGWSEGR